MRHLLVMKHHLTHYFHSRVHSHTLRGREWGWGEGGDFSLLALWVMAVLHFDFFFLLHVFASAKWAASWLWWEATVIHVCLRLPRHRLSVFPFLLFFFPLLSRLPAHIESACLLHALSSCAPFHSRLRHLPSCSSSFSFSQPPFDSCGEQIVLGESTLAHTQQIDANIFLLAELLTHASFTSCRGKDS